MSDHQFKIEAAYWTAPGCACILLEDNWNFEALPPFKLNDPAMHILRLRRMPSSDLGYFTAYERREGHILFKIDPRRHPHVNFHDDPVAVVGAFNNWGDCADRLNFELSSSAPHSLEALFFCEVPIGDLNLENSPIDFKFRTRSGHWIKPLSCAPNLKKDAVGNLNYTLNPNSNGQQAFLFNLENQRGLDRPASISIDDGNFMPIVPGLGFYDLKSDAPLGAIIENDFSTTFRIFAPRATKVFIETQLLLDQDTVRHELHLNYDQITWEINIQDNLSGFYYNYFIEGINDDQTTFFDGTVPILDPYAQATLGPEGPGIVVNHHESPRIENPFHPPNWQDLSILECHVGDMTRYLPDSPKSSFRALSNYLNSEDSYLLTLGINTVELLPIQQFDGTEKEAYHWGYMTNNYFSPSSWYASEEGKNDQNEAFKKMVSDFHDKQKSVLLDVVYNHVGEPSHLARIDKAYYFYLTDEGNFENWSGCGNTIRCESAMSQRLIIDSLSHLVRTYDVDGFRFDLAELVGIEVLKEVELALKAIKPSIILIAEPWSFRGEIKRDLRLAGFMFWNDEFREFAHRYVLGNASIDALAYFTKGATQHLSGWPSQSINYIESHDDRCWIDKITENARHRGNNPTQKDILRTHLAAALMYCSLGTPMLASGVDFLKSKKGVRNTYQRGDLNGLNYEAISEHRNTHNYFKNWILFRQSGWGECLRLDKLPSPNFIRFFRSNHTEHSSAAILFNADLSHGHKQILLMLNPHQEYTQIPMGNPLHNDWKVIASIDTFDFDGIDEEIPIDQDNAINLGPLCLLLAVRPSWNS